MSNIINWISTIAIVFVVLSIALGFFRGWAKALARFVCLFVGFLVALFVSPAIASAVINKFTNGTTISLAGLTFDFQELINNVSGDGGVVADLLSAENTTSDLAKGLMNIVINLVLFLLIFIVISVLSYLVYFIVTLVMSRKRKREGETIEKTQAYWWLKVLGGGIGLISSVVVCLAFLNPVFGVMNICDRLVVQEESSAEKASATLSSNLICGELYYKEDKNIGQVEVYIEKYSEIRDAYNKSVMGAVFNATGIKSLGSMTFGYLTNVKQGNLKTNFTDEFISIVNTYNAYKKAFVINKFDITNNESIDNFVNLYNNAKQSEVVKNYVTEFVPNFYQKWSTGEKFMGMECPVKGDFQTIFLEILKVFNTSSFKQIDNNLLNLTDVVKIANNHNIIKNSRNNISITDTLIEGEGFIEEVVVELSSTLEMRRALPVVLNETIDILYKQVVGDGRNLEKANLTNAEIDSIDFSQEGKVIENAFVKILKVFKNIDGKDDSALISELKNIGAALDNARESKIIAKPMKGFMIGFAEKNLEGNVKDTLINNIEKYWDITENPENAKFKFENMFEAIEGAAKIADSLGKDSQDINVSDLAGVLEVIIDNETLKDEVTQAITNNIIGDVVDNPDDAEILSDMLDTFVNNIETKEDIPAELEAGQALVDIMNNAKQNDNEVVLTEGQEQTEANDFVDTIINSNAIMAMVKENGDDSALKDTTTDMKGDVSFIKSAIDEYDTKGDAELEANKKALQKLFGTAGYVAD